MRSIFDAPGQTGPEPHHRRTRMPLGFTKAILAGKVSDAGVKVSYTDAGIPEAQWVTIVQEAGPHGATWTTYVPCSAWNKSAETIGQLIDPGDEIVILDGKLKFRSWTTKAGEKKTRMEVSTSRVQIVEKTPAAVGTSSDN